MRPLDREGMQAATIGKQTTNTVGQIARYLVTILNCQHDGSLTLEVKLVFAFEVWPMF